VEWTKDDADFKRQYYALNRCFNPVRFDAKGIAGLAKRCGFRYVTFTTKHHDGFCLYDTKYTDFKTTAPECPYSSSPNADIVKSLFDACRAEGLGIGAYFSKPDFHHTDFWEDFGIGKATSRYPTYDIRKQPEKWARFCEFTKNQILELVSGYGPIDIMWLDGGWLKEEKGQPLSNLICSPIMSLRRKRTERRNLLMIRKRRLSVRSLISNESTVKTQFSRA
jgi:alpha-L-fucosidase